jgi:hypothetical protein
MPFLALIVTLLAIGASVLLGVLGYLIDKNNSEPTELSPDGRARGGGR